METTTSSTRAQEINEWIRKDMTSAYQKQLCIVDPYRFTNLLLNVAHNVRTVTPEAIREQFEQDLQSSMDSAREVFAANLCEIYAAALANLADIQEPEDDMGEPYLPSHPDALRVIVGDNGSRTIVGARGYLRMRREALDEGQDIAPWAELERYPAE
jgi:hypothetical protein